MTPSQLREELAQNIASLTQQRDQALATYHQAVGALSIAEAVLHSLENDDALPLDKLAEMVGGEGATAEVRPNDEG